MNLIFRLLISFLLFFYQFGLFASEGEAGSNMVHKMTILVFQIVTIIFVAKAAGMLFSKFKLPSVLGELCAGIIIGPYLLGAVPLPGFPGGLFPIIEGAIPISSELYGMATFASIILLFMAGLETDIEMFLRYSLAGTIVGIGGIVFSFGFGSLVGMYFLNQSFLSPAVLFLGVMSTATSVGITARILSEKRSMDSPEGVTIIAGAVIDDVLGIIILAVVLGVSGVLMSGNKEQIEWGHIGLIAFKAIGIWCVFTALGLVFAHKISNTLKKFNDKNTISILALGLALLISGIFEQAGLAMIVGAYVTGLSLSKTDISYVIQETLHPLHMLFVPLFFAVSGMLVDLRVFGSKEVLIFGLVYSTGAILAKFIGCGLPSFFLGFNKLGAIRIGLGMIPRGEVALIIAGIGMANGIFNQTVFGVSIMMTFLTTVFAPPFFNAALSIKGKGTNKEPITGNTVSTEYIFDSDIITNNLVVHILNYLSKEGFYVYMMEVGHKVYQIRKDTIFIKLAHYPGKLEFITSPNDVAFVKTITYEAFIKLSYSVNKINNDTFPEKMRNDLSSGISSKDTYNLSSIIHPDCIKMDIKSDTKEGIIEELVNLFDDKSVQNKPEIIKEVLERESVISTGMEKGVAIPHARTDEVSRACIAIGIKRNGINFDSIDHEPTKLIILVLSSETTNDPHIQILAAISTMVINNNAVEKILEAKTKEEVWKIFYDFSAKKS